MGKAIISIRYTLLEAVLEMPANANILDVMWDKIGEDHDRGQVRFMVESPELPETGEGEMVPHVSPTIRRVDWDWGLPDFIQSDRKSDCD